MAKSYELKPNRAAFVNYSFIKNFIYSLIFFLIAYLILNKFISVIYFITAFILLEIFIYYSLTVKYSKERYIFLPDKIIRRSGGIFSDKETELVIRNITHVTLRLPFIQYKLFQTGNIGIESAGSGGTEVFMHSIDNSKQVYEYTEKIMMYNGFRLKKSKLIQQERPSVIGVFFEVFKNFIGTIFIIFYAGTFIGAGLLATFASSLVLTIILIFLILIFLFARSILKFLDLKRRVYDVYSDTITYSEGFLSKTYSFIPMENLADSTLTQTLIDKIFSLYDVKISCQGSNQEILFKNMVNGHKLESNIDALISKSKSLVGTEKKTKEAKVQKQAHYKAKPLQVATSFTAEYKMDGGRTIIPFLFLFLIFPLIPLWIIMLIPVIIKMSCTRYLVKPNSMEEEYEFLSAKHKEFTNEKITAIIFKESFIDKWFNTCSIHFWSIGSSEDIKFSNIKKSEGLYENILAKMGVRPQQPIYQMNSQFKISDFFKATLPLTLIAVVVLISSIVGMVFFGAVFLVPLILLIFVYAIIIIYRHIYYQKSKLKFFKDYVYFKRGIFFEDYYHALYNNIKDITTIKYPFSSLGFVQFNVAGEHTIQHSRQRQGQIVSNKFKIKYIENIDNKDELIDLIFYKRPNAQQIAQIENNIQAYSPQPILVSKQDVANSIIFPLILPPLWLFIPFIIWSIKVRSYIIQPYRALAKSGILYKKQTSIIFSKVDHINFSQGALNKMFKNGNIRVNTAGSSKAELVIINIHNFKDFYEVLKKYY